jgi:hypothetical protein
MACHNFGGRGRVFLAFSVAGLLLAASISAFNLAASSRVRYPLGRGAGLPHHPVLADRPLPL